MATVGVDIQGMVSRRWRKDYARKKYQNPFFHTVHKPKKYRAVVVRLAGFFAAAGWVWFLIFSSYFYIDAILISGAGGAELQEAVRTEIFKTIDQKKLFFLPQRSLLVLNAAALAKELAAKFYLKSLDVRKQYPRGLSVKFVPREPWGAIVSKGGGFEIDSDGVLLDGKNEWAHFFESPALTATASSTARAATTTVREAITFRLEAASTLRSSREVGTAGIIIFADKGAGYSYRQTEEEKTISRTRELTQALAVNFALPIAYFEIESNGDLTAVTETGGRLLFTTEADLTAQTTALVTIVKKRIKEHLKDIDYIDLRYDERVFYKFLR